MRCLRETRFQLQDVSFFLCFTKQKVLLKTSSTPWRSMDSWLCSLTPISRPELIQPESSPYGATKPRPSLFGTYGFSSPICVTGGSDQGGSRPSDFSVQVKTTSVMWVSRLSRRDVYQSRYSLFPSYQSFLRSCGPWSTLLLHKHTSPGPRSLLTSNGLHYS